MQMPPSFEQAIAIASRTIQAYTYPLLWVDEQARPYVVASCVFLDVSGMIYLVTAAHAIRGHSRGLLTRGQGHLIDVTGPAAVSRAAGKDNFDIAAIQFDLDVVREHNIAVVPESMLSTLVEVENPQSRAVCGFPVSMNKQVPSLDRKTKTVSAKCYTYFGSAIFDGDFESVNKSPERHVGLNYISGSDETGRFLSSPPSPRGISGGGAWLVPDLSRPSLVFLEGIVIEAYKKTRTTQIFSTRLEEVLGFIQQTRNPPLHRTR